MNNLDAQGRFRLYFNFDSQQIILKLSIVQGSKIYNATIPFIEQEMKPVHFEHIGVTQEGEI